MGCEMGRGMAPAHTLELRLAQRSDNAYRVELRFRAPMSSTESQPVSDATAHFDWPYLLSASLDPEEYGRRLTAMLFASQEMRVAWAAARAEARGAGATLHMRLVLDASDVALNSLNWETLRDPKHFEGAPLVADEHILLSRQPFSREVANAQASLAEFQPTVLARSGGERAVTLNAIVDALRDGVDVLYLVAHGSRHNAEGLLWLEREDGTSERVIATDFASRIAGLSRRPLLIFLALCRSADELAAVGPLLATAGIPAVVAMQGNVAITTIAHLAPTFFRELQRDGDVERALAAARGSVLDQTDWWLPVLYSRLADGRIWLPADPHKVPRSLASPFRALDAFTVEGAHLFFGRDVLINEGYERWVASDRRFLAVVGASGSGKSSLAQAGLIPRFSADLRELRYCPTYLIIRPGEHPLRALRDELRRKGVPIPSDFAERLRADATLLSSTLPAWHPAETEGEPAILLLVDQFEELFTLCTDEAERRCFDAALCHAVEQPGGKVSILLTLRSDFYRHTSELGLRAHIATYQVHVRNLHPDEMEEAIVAPVRALAGEGPPRFEPGLEPIRITQ